MGSLISENLKRCFADGQYSDMQVKDRNNNVYKVHKLVMCGQCPFFRNALKDGNFKEGHTNLVELAHDDPAVVKAMLEFFYLEEYAPPDTESTTVEERLHFHLNVFFIAQKYMVADSLLSGYAGAQVHQILFSGPEREQVKAAFPRALLAVYEHTPEGEPNLRPIFVDFASWKLQELLKEDDFRSAMKSLEGFGLELSEKLGKKIESLKGRVIKFERYNMDALECYECGNLFKQLTLDEADDECPYCSADDVGYPSLERSRVGQ